MKQEMLEARLIARPYGVTGISLGGCVEGSPIHPGQPAAMRRSAHAHHDPHYDYHGHICFKAHSLERVSLTLFWHEVAHIWRRSWTEKQCDKWARQQAGAALKQAKLALEGGD